MHNDLKLTNVLKDGTKEYLYKDGSHCIQDVYYKCLVGLVEIGFWKVLEIFQQLNNKVSMSKIAFINKCNVYSYYMTRYKLVLGWIHLDYLSNLLRKKTWAWYKEHGDLIINLIGQGRANKIEQTSTPLPSPLNRQCAWCAYLKLLEFSFIFDTKFFRGVLIYIPLNVHC